MKILDENCDPKVAEDPKLPYTAYLIQYADKEVVKYDLSIGYSKVELFDHYLSLIHISEPTRPY